MSNVQAVERSSSELDDIDALVRTYRPRLLRFVTFSIGDPDLAESITQDCFLKAYNGRDKFRGDCSVNTWLTSIALNLIRDQQRLQKFRFWRQARATAIDVSDAANFLPSHESSAEARILAHRTNRSGAGRAGESVGQPAGDLPDAFCGRHGPFRDRSRRFRCRSTR
jgi:RNA polymerase sigma-70 factor (ECF subfamily)